jgi:hypothetical protein
MSYLLHLDGNSGTMNAPQYHIICTLSVMLIFKSCITKFSISILYVAHLFPATHNNFISHCLSFMFLHSIIPFTSHSDVSIYYCCTYNDTKIACLALIFPTVVLTHMGVKGFLCVVAVSILLHQHLVLCPSCVPEKVGIN